jgi:hypothetical protein
MRSVCLDCGQFGQPTAATVDQIARVHLALRRCGCSLELRNADPCLLELIALVGLGEVLRVESRRQAEEREQSGGVEKEGELFDPSVL